MVDRPKTETNVYLHDDNRDLIEGAIDRRSGDSLGAVVRDAIDEYVASGGLDEKRWRDDDD